MLRSETIAIETPVRNGNYQMVARKKVGLKFSTFISHDSGTEKTELRK